MKKTLEKELGFTLLELMVALGIMGVLAAVSVPSILQWLPGHHLKSAAREVYSTLQGGRLLAVKRNSSVRVYFDNTVTPGRIVVAVPDNGGDFTMALDQPGEYQINLSEHGSGVDFGITVGLKNWSNNDINSSVTFGVGPPAYCTYKSDGTAELAGTVYLINDQARIVFAITTVTSGSVKLRKYNGFMPFNKNNWVE